MWFYFVALWVVLTALTVATLYSDILRALVIHGKVRQDTKLGGRGMISFLTGIEMNKSGWIYFYCAGACFNGAIAIALIMFHHHPVVQQIMRLLQSSRSDAAAAIVVHGEVVLVIGLLWIHTTRRFLESVFITEFGTARMHVSVFIAGLIHYVGVAPALLSSPQSVGTTSVTVHPALVVVGTALHFYGAYHQFVCNKLVALQKAKSGGNHVVPKGDWFELVLSPLYTSELLIYAGFAVLCGLTNAMVDLVLLWVVVNQSICALYSKRWYHEKFRSEKLAKWALVPGVW